MLDRFHKLLNQVSESIEAAQKTYKGEKRSNLKDNDFLFPETRSFPIVSPQDVPDAISNFGRMKGKMSYDAFIHKLYNKIKNKPDFVAALPEATKEYLGLKKKSTNAGSCKVKSGDLVQNVNTSCMHYGSIGTVDGIEEIPDQIGNMVTYRTINSGKNWNKGDSLTKTEDQLKVIAVNDLQLVPHREPVETTNDFEDLNTIMADDMENETPEIELQEYKTEFYEMSVASLKAIASHVGAILEHLDNPRVKENLTESWLQGKIAVAEDYVRTIHDFIKYASETDDTITAADRPGLWENIRKKKERMGKKYKPAKPGDKGRPDSEQWKKLTEDK